MVTDKEREIWRKVQDRLTEMVVHELTCWVCGCYWVTIDEIWESFERDEEYGAQFLKTQMTEERVSKQLPYILPSDKGERDNRRDPYPLEIFWGPGSDTAMARVEAMRRVMEDYENGNLTERERSRVTVPWAGRMILVTTTVEDQEQLEAYGVPFEEILYEGHYEKYITPLRLSMNCFKPFNYPWLFIKFLNKRGSERQAAEEEFICRELFIELFGCSYNTISELTGLSRKKVEVYLAGPKKAFNEEKREVIKKLLDAGMTHEQISQELRTKYPFASGISRTSVTNILADSNVDLSEED